MMQSAIEVGKTYWIKWYGDRIKATVIRRHPMGWAIEIKGETYPVTRANFIRPAK